MCYVINAEGGINTTMTQKNRLVTSVLMVTEVN